VSEEDAHVYAEDVRRGGTLVTRVNETRADSANAVLQGARDTEHRIERIHAIAVANNNYDEGFGRIFSRNRLDAGTLTLYVLRHLATVTCYVSRPR